MIGFLRGQVIERTTHSILLDVQGVGFDVLVPTRVAEKVELDKPLSLYTHLAVREDALTLFGFGSRAEKELFDLLVGISGIGPKIALAILSTYSPEQVQQAIAAGNSAAFSAVSGIGKKNAERIVLELKNKVVITALPGESIGGSELHQALSGLGYSAAEAIQLSQGIDPALPLQQQLKAALAKAGG